MAETHVVILAAGQGTRMKSLKPKVLHFLAGKPLLDHVLKTARKISPASITLVVGYHAEAVRKHLNEQNDVQIVVQKPQLGTAHALQQVEPFLATSTGQVLLLSGDVPLLSHKTLARLIRTHDTNSAAATVVTAVLEKPYGYGRIVRTADAIARIVEERDASPTERNIKEINSGIYLFDFKPLWSELRQIASNNVQGEYYITDLVTSYRRQNFGVATLLVDNPQEIRGINSRTELADVSRIARKQKNEELMAAGVTLIDPATTYIEDDVEVGRDTVIHPGVILERQTKIGDACEIHANVRIKNALLGNSVTVHNFCLIIGAQIGNGASIGPFAHLRPDSEIGDKAKVGNFVELKNTTLGPGAKANHLSYLGDATIGSKANIGAGTITCNYDGERKYSTVIEDNAFIGSNTQLVAPVHVGKGAYVAAGSSITKNIPDHALGIARAQQTNIENWADRPKTTAKTDIHPSRVQTGKK